ncbi:hypothetical protein [Dongia sp.]|uniref:hypothetical protein n=1 Tax=Dongia sp. TaxID=1977262 RepID=UPI0035B307F1
MRPTTPNNLTLPAKTVPSALLKLPLRLVPRPSRQWLLTILVLLFLPVFALIQFAPEQILGGQSAKTHFDWYHVLELIAFFFGWIGCVLKLLPRSPLWFLEMDKHGLTFRRLWRRKRVSWSAVTQFAAIEIKVGSHSWWRIVGDNLPPGLVLPEKRRLKAGNLVFDTDPLLPLFANKKQRAVEMAAWLQQVSYEQRRADSPDRVNLPAFLKPNAIAAAVDTKNERQLKSADGNKTVQRYR